MLAEIAELNDDNNTESYEYHPSVHGPRKKGHQVLYLVYPVEAYAALLRQLFMEKAGM